MLVHSCQLMAVVEGGSGSSHASLGFLPCAASASVSRCVPDFCCAPPRLQGAFKRVAADVEALGHELAGLLRKRLLAAPDQVCLGRKLQKPAGAESCCGDCTRLYLLGLCRRRSGQGRPAYTANPGVT